MAVAPEPRLLHAFFEFGEVEKLDKPSKAALRLCNKQIMAAIDAAVIACTVKPDAVDALMRCDWPLTKLDITGDWQNPSASTSFKTLPVEAVSKFPLLETLAIDGCRDLASLPDNIGQWSRLKNLRINAFPSLKALPPSFSQLTQLEDRQLVKCYTLTMEGITPLKHLKQLKSLEIISGPGHDSSFPQWILGILTTSLESLTFSGKLAAFLPAIGKFKNLKRLVFSGYDSRSYPIEFELPGSI